MKKDQISAYISLSKKWGFQATDEFFNYFLTYTSRVMVKLNNWKSEFLTYTSRENLKLHKLKSDFWTNLCTGIWDFFVLRKALIWCFFWKIWILRFS